MDEQQQRLTQLSNAVPIFRPFLWKRKHTKRENFIYLLSEESLITLRDVVPITKRCQCKYSQRWIKII